MKYEYSRVTYECDLCEYKREIVGDIWNSSERFFYKVESIPFSPPLDKIICSDCHKRIMVPALAPSGAAR